MRFYSLLDFQYAVLAFFLGLIAALLLYLGFKGTKREMEEEETETIQYLEGLSSTKHSIPPLLIFLYIGFAVWAVIYVIFVAIRAENI